MRKSGCCLNIQAALLAIAVLGVLVGCRTTQPPTLTRFEFKQPHMGTLFAITLYAADENVARQASDLAFKKIAELDATMSDYKTESELMQLCKKPHGRPVPVSSDLFSVLSRSLIIAARSEGAFDPTVGPVVRLWRRARRTGELPDASQLGRARMSVGWEKLRCEMKDRTITLTAPNMQLDLGGIAKGYAADAALAVLRDRGVTRALVAASGDIAAGDPPPGQSGWRVAIGVPISGSNQPGTFARTLSLKNAAVSTSGDAEQFVEIGGVRYSHIVDPRTGLGLTNQIQVTVIARTATDTDAFATTVCVLGIEPGLRLVESQSGMAALILSKSATGDWCVTESKRLAKILRE